MHEKFFPFIKQEEYAEFQYFMPALSLAYEDWLEQHHRLPIRNWEAQGERFVARPITVSLREFRDFLHGRAPTEDLLRICAKNRAKLDEAERAKNRGDYNPYK